MLMVLFLNMSSEITLEITTLFTTYQWVNDWDVSPFYTTEHNILVPTDYLVRY